jgi:Putative porin
MFDKKPDARRGLMPLAVSLCALICAVPAFAQSSTDQGEAATKKSDRKADEKKPSVSQTKPTSPNMSVNLINLLVKRGTLKEEEAQELIKQAEDESYVSRQAAKDATAKADEAAKAASAATAVANPPGTRHVTYVPEIVKRELREEIKAEVMAKAQKENWASPGAYPEWAERIHFSGDMRVRYQGNFFPGGNDQGGATNFNAINSGSPYDVSHANQAFAPTLDDTQNRNYLQIRGRLGMDADLSNGFSAGLRLATGNSSTPVSTNQTLGSVASGGDFSKYSLWLDRGFIKYRGWDDDLVLNVGRFDNPFWSPTDLVWYRDLGFDGFAVQTKYSITKDITPFAVAGAFPIYNTDLNAGINLPDPTTGEPVKLANDRWLFGGQVGFSDRFAPQSSFRLAVAYYDFQGVQGQVSTPCSVDSASDVCSTDLLRPSFAQYGNTYMPLRNIIADANNNFGAINQFQYFGLASAFRPVVASGQVDFGDFHPVHVVLDGEFVWNSAFNRAAISAVAVNNLAGTADGSLGPFNGGSVGGLGRITVGDREIKHLWDWNVHAGYKYLESDATIDAFVDSDFGLGGTNLKGYFLGGNLGLSENVWATLRWMSATNIAGSPYAVDILQVDINARF